MSIRYAIAFQFLFCTAGPNVPNTHPAAPLELKQKSSEFVNEINSSKPQDSQTKGSTESISIYHDFWDAPLRFWKPKVRQLDDEEMDAIMVRLYLVYSIPCLP